MYRREETISFENREFNKDYYYGIGNRLLSFVGQWPYQTPKEKRRSFAMFSVLAITVIIPQMAQFFVCDDSECLIQSTPTYMLAVMVVIKISTYNFNKGKIKNLTDHLFVDWNTLETEEEYEILKKYAGNGRRYALMYTIFVYVGIVAFASTCLVPRILDVVSPLNTSRPTMMIAPVYYFVDGDEYFYYIFFHVLIVAEICITGLLAHDCMFFIYIEHVCGLFAVVGFRFEYWVYRYNNEKENLINCSGDVYCRKIAFSIATHLKALQFAILLEKTFSISFGVQMLFVTVGMAITLVQVSIQMHSNILETMRYVLFIVGQLFHLFFLSFEGQKLIDHSLETHDKIYNGLWYEIPVKPQKLLLFAMKKSAEVSVLTAGKIYIFCREGFTTVMQTSMSYFTVLSSANE